MTRSQLARNLAAGAALQTGCMLEPNLSRPGARTLRMQVQAPSKERAAHFWAGVQVAFAANGLAADVEPPAKEQSPGLPTCWTVLMCVTVESN